MQDDLIDIGYIARAHGVRGELRVHLHNPDSEALSATEAVFLDGQRHELARVRQAGKGAYLIELAGVRDRDAAEALRGAVVAVARALVADDDDVLVAELVGCAVQLPDGTAWGTVARYEPGPQDRLIIRDGDIERQLPVVDAFLVDIDLARGMIVVDPPEGLPEDPVADRPDDPADA